MTVDYTQMLLGNLRKLIQLAAFLFGVADVFGSTNAGWDTRFSPIANLGFNTRALGINDESNIFYEMDGILFETGMPFEPLLPRTIDLIETQGRDVFVAGDLRDPNGKNVGKIGKWNGSKWDFFGGGPPWSVQAMLPSGDKLYVAGGRSNVAVWDGRTWTNMGSITNLLIYTLAIHEGELYAGGSAWDKSITNTIRGIAKWDGKQWVDWSRELAHRWLAESMPYSRGVRKW